MEAPAPIYLFATKLKELPISEKKFRGQQHKVVILASERLMHILFMWPRVTVAVLLAALISVRGLRKKSLSENGAVAAFFVASVSMGCAYRFGIVLLMFYLTGSKLTKYKEHVKQQLDSNCVEGGQRSASQVFACSILATILCVVFAFTVGEDTPVNYSRDYDGSFLQCAILAHYACCAADTWASELGMLDRADPILITCPWRHVPKGTNGGVSLIGMVASAGGGACMGACYYLCELLFIPSASSDASDPSFPLGLVVLGIVTGLFGSVLDSVLGATLQVTYYNKDKKMVVSGTEAKDSNKGDKSLEHVCGIDILNNYQVNAVSVLLTTLVGGYLGVYFV